MTELTPKAIADMREGKKIQDLVTAFYPKNLEYFDGACNGLDHRKGGGVFLTAMAADGVDVNWHKEQLKLLSDVPS